MNDQFSPRHTLGSVLPERRISVQVHHRKNDYVCIVDSVETPYGNLRVMRGPSVSIDYRWRCLIGLPSDTFHLGRISDERKNDDDTDDNPRYAE